MATQAHLRRTETKPKSGIVHLGVGAFFRAHAAIYIQQAMARSGGDWGVTGVSLRSANVRDSLVANDFLYTAGELAPQGVTTQTITSLTDVLVAPEDPGAVLAAMAEPATKIVSLTVTEKGYCQAAGRLDLSHPDIAHDLRHETPKSAPGYLVRALALRRDRGLQPFTVLSLDNLPENGHTVRAAVLDLARQVDPDLADWIASQARFPCTMVDRIVPAMTPQAHDTIEKIIGFRDLGAVVHEPFRQWVIEDDFVLGLRPDFAAAGTTLVNDVGPFENMKLRMLNGTHSALAYLGTLLGHETVAQAAADPVVERFIDDLWAHELAPSLAAPKGVDLGDYAAALKSRYQNPQIQHQLMQIAMDGSQKLPQRILNALFENRAAGRQYSGLIAVVASWMRFIQGAKKFGHAINDPLAAELAAAASSAHSDADLVRNITGLAPVFGTYPANDIAAELLAALPGIDAMIDASNNRLKT